MIDRKAGRCLLLDWKTNSVSLGETENFRSRYRPQLAAYWKAVSEITHFDVEAGLFSTALGCSLLYTADELQEEWNRLEQLPPAKLDEEMQPDAPAELGESSTESLMSSSMGTSPKSLPSARIKAILLSSCHGT